MIVRLLFFAVVISIGCKVALGKWPWDFLRSPPSRSQALFRARKLLAVRQGAGRDEIIDAHRRLLAVVHPDKGGTNSQVHEANAARDLLLDELPDGN